MRSPRAHLQRHNDISPEESFVAALPRLRLEAEAPLAPQVEPVRRERNVSRGALFGAERRPSVGVGGEPVMDVDRRQRQASIGGERTGRVEQHHRIDSTGERDRELRAVAQMTGQRCSERRVDGRDHLGGFSPRRVP